MVGRREEEGPLRQDWEPWEARRASAPKGLPPEVREARSDAKLLLLVVRTRLGLGEAPLEHAERLAKVARDERLPTRRRRMAAQYLARLRMAAMARASSLRVEIHGGTSNPARQG